MGIKGLTGLLTEHAPKSMSDHDIKTMFGRKVAIDASMSLYQFLIAVRQKDGEQMTNEAGEVTSHLLGTFYRTIRMVDNGIKPCYVFDGKPPDMKGGVLKDRLAKREKAKEDEAEAKETGTVEDVDKMSRRQVRVTKEQNAEVQRLLKLMGIPCVVAPGEAEAQCAELARGGKVYGAGSEDMDTLTFNSPILLRHLTFSEAKKAPIMEVHLDKALEGLGMEMEQFIELCILMGCDYLEPIKGIGPSTAYKLMKEHGSLKHVVAHLRGKQAARDGEVAAAVAEESEEEEEEVVESEKESEDGHGEQGLDEEDKVDEEEGGSIKKGGKKRARVTDDSDEDNDNDDFPPPSKAGNSDSDADEDNPEPSASKTKGKGKASPVKKSTKKAAPKVAGGGGKKAAPKKRGGIIIPEDWNWQGAKELFLRPDVVKSTDVEIEWTAPDVEGLVDFLVREKGFSEDRVRNGAGKLQKMINAKQQGRLDGFFKVLPKDPSSKKAPEPAAKGKRKGTAGGKDDKKDTKKAKTTVKKK